MPGLFDGAFSGGGLLPYDDPRHARALMPTGNFVDDPFATAAMRARQSLQPPAGRPQGAVSSMLQNYLPHVAQVIATLPARALGAAGQLQRTGDYDPGPVLETATMMVGAPLTPRGALGSSIGRLPMDEASRLARARQLGYAEEPFFRGEATGKKPTEFTGGGFFSRDVDTARGFAQRGGAMEPAEYRLNLGNTFDLSQPVSAEIYGRLIGELRKTDPKLASDMVDLIAPGRGIDWYTEFAARNPNVTVAANGAHVHQLIERGSRDPVGTFVRAGFDAIDAGRDVRKLTGEGIRSKDAAFDPAKWKSRDILASLAGLLSAPLAAATDSPKRE
jgi:hypothetical protein